MPGCCMIISQAGTHGRLTDIQASAGPPTSATHWHPLAACDKHKAFTRAPHCTQPQEDRTDTHTHAGRGAGMRALPPPSAGLPVQLQHWQAAMPASRSVQLHVFAASRPALAFTIR